MIEIVSIFFFIFIDPKSSLERFLEVFIDDLFLISKKNLKKSTEYFLVIKLVVTMSPRIIRRIYEKKNL